MGVIARRSWFRRRRKYLWRRQLFGTNGIKYYLEPKSGYMILIGLFGYLKIRMPSSYFFKEMPGYYVCQDRWVLSVHKNFILFWNKHYYKNFLARLRTGMELLNHLYCYRIRVWGLGFRIRRVCMSLYRFYFIWSSYMYLHVPREVWIRCRLQRILLVSNNYVLLKDVVFNILLLKGLIPYRRKGIHYPRRVRFLKKGKKTF